MRFAVSALVRSLHRAASMPVACRRRCFAGLTIASGGTLFVLMAATLSRGGFSGGEVFLLGCFLVTLPWTTIGFWNAVIGLVLLRFSSNPAALACPPLGKVRGDEPIEASTALLVCVRNEAVDTVARNIGVIAEGLIRSGQADRFAIHLLSDTDCPLIAEQEQAAFANLDRRFAGRITLRYRRRADNTGFKAGNIADFCRHWGERYDFALPLDADSFMSTEAIFRLVRVMQADPGLGIVQSLVTGLPSASGFARIFQFGMRHGMRSYTIGGAWWQADCGPYWGHNALIRLEPFMAHCRLPVLAGTGPLSGCILSHDQIEAVLMRRAGYHVRVIPQDEGSWEENPTSLPEFIRRDLRWCQGNMQYFSLLGMAGLKPVSRLQLALAIGMFLSAPAWIAFVVTVSMMSLFGSDPAAMFWPASGTIVFAIVMTMVFAPKLASLLDTLGRSQARRNYGGAGRLIAGALLETVFSMLLAPIMAVAQTAFMAGLPFGKKIGWPAQQRGAHAVSLGYAARRLWMPTAFGMLALAWLAGGWGAGAWLALPVFVGPLLSIPLAMMTATRSLGAGLVRLGLVAVPEEFAQPPAILALQLEAMAERREGARRGTSLQPAAQSVNP